MQNAFTLTQEAQIRNFKQIKIDIEHNLGILWVYQRPYPRPCYNWTIVEELRAIQNMLEINNGYLPSKGDMVKINYLVLDSSIPDIFSMGGDLNLFYKSIVSKDVKTLSKYARLCIDTIHGFVVGCRQPITTIALVRGDAMGGGFEVALSCQVIIAEQEVEMGFPELLFNLFPGMGGYHMLSQRLPVKQVEKMMQSGVTYSSELLHEMGVVDRIAKKDEGREAVYSYIKQASKYSNSFSALKNVREKLHPITHEELIEISKYWVEIAMNLSDRDLKLMQRLVRAQNRKAEAGYIVENVESLIEKSA